MTRHGSRDTQKKRRREEGGRSVWSTSLIFTILIVLTALMFLGLKGLTTGTMRFADQIEIKALKGP